MTVSAAPTTDRSWPELSSPPGGVEGAGRKDSAVIVGLESYAAVSPVPGALLNANDWHSYLTGFLRVPLERTALLRDNEATRESIEEKVRDAAASVEPGGTLWFVFIGHGAPSKDGKDGLLVGWDAQQRADSLFARSVSKQELLKAMAKGRQARAVVLVDACFSGRTPEGAPLVPGLQPLILTAAGAPSQLAASRAIVMTAARSDQFAGPLPGGSRPAFSYLALGALRGWADEARSGTTTPEALIAYVGKSLRSLQARQQPELTAFNGGQSFSVGREKGPDLGQLARSLPAAPAPASGSAFQFSSLPALPRSRAPETFAPAASNLDMGSVDVDSLEKYDAAVKLDKSGAAPEEKAAAWRKLAGKAPAFADRAEKRAKQWDAFAAQEALTEAAREERLPARDADWVKLGKLLTLDVVSAGDKLRWSGQFVTAYLDMPGLEAEMVEKLGPHLQPELRKRLAGRNFARAEKLARYSADGFSLSLSEKWKLVSGGREDDDYGRHLFTDEAAGRKLLVLRLRPYKPRKVSGGILFMVISAQEFIQQMVRGHMLVQEIVEQPGTFEIAGNVYQTLTRKVIREENGFCMLTADELCKGSLQQFAATKAGENVYVLAFLSPLDSAPLPSKDLRAIARSFQLQL